MAKLDDRGREILDDTPVAIPVKFKRPETLAEQIRRVIREEASRAAQHAGYETFEEADDFDVEDDDYNPRSPHELSLDQELEGYARNEGRPPDETKPPAKGDREAKTNRDEGGEKAKGTPGGGSEGPEKSGSA